MTRPLTLPMAPKPAKLRAGAGQSEVSRRTVCVEEGPTHMPSARSCSPRSGKSVVIMVSADGMVSAAPVRPRRVAGQRRWSGAETGRGSPMPWMARKTKSMGPSTEKPSTMEKTPTTAKPVTNSVFGPYMALNLPPCSAWTSISRAPREVREAGRCLR